MLSSRTVIQALKRETDPRIFARGHDYAQRKLVKRWTVEDGDDGAVTVHGEVKGSDLYDVTLEFDRRGSAYTFECTCPYAEDDTCKHIVALGLVFAQSLAAEEPEPLMHKKRRGGTPSPRRSSPLPPDVPLPDEPSEADAAVLREQLQGMGIDADAMPPHVFAQLLKYRTENASPASASQSDATGSVSHAQFHPERYGIIVSPHDFRVNIRLIADPYRDLSIKKMLAQEGVSSEQRELLTYIDKSRFSSHSADPAYVVPLMVRSGFRAFSALSPYHTQPITLKISPPPLQATLVYEPRPVGNDGRVRHDFVLRMPASYWRNGSFSGRGATLVHVSSTAFNLYTLTPALVTIIMRMHAPYETPRAAQYESHLNGVEIIHIDTIAADAARLLALSGEVPAFTPHASRDTPFPALHVTYDSAAQELRVDPVVDYGHCAQRISESVVMRHSWSGGGIERRSPIEHTSTHQITVRDGMVVYTPADEAQEKQLFRTIRAHAEALGFTKTLKCTRTGVRQITRYLSDTWPVLTQFAHTHGYPIHFTKDVIAFERANFRANFSADLNAEHDWLHFDLACYCGDEKVTLEKLLAYLKSGDTFFRRDDGTLVEFANRDELERLARLLQSFHAREEGGFEGRAYHAPELQYVMTSSAHYSAARAKSFEQFMTQMHTGAPIKKVKLPRALEKVLRPYQKAGIEWMYFLRSYRFAGILADDMGLGKTLQTLAIMHLERVEGKPSLVVCPKTLLYNWKNEAATFFPSMRVLVYDGTPTERKALQQQLKEHDLVIASYNTVKQDEKAFAARTMQFNYAVLDEAQFIKNHVTKNAQIVKKLNADYRLALTGTPLENSVSELWSMYDFLMPGFLGSYEHFAKQFHRPIMDKGDHHALEHLRKKVECFMLRRTKTEVLTELPPKIEQTSQCHLSNAQNVLYQQILAKVRGDVFAAVKNKGFSSSQIHILAGLTKLRQACNHPALLTGDKDFRKYESAKLDMCLELVEEVTEGKRKVLIFSQFTQMLDIVAAALTENHVPYLYLSGKTKNRQALVDQFNTDPSIPVFLISLKAGGTGLNLASADTVIIFDPWWNPSVENQAVDRAHRIGQTRTVNVYRLLTQGTIEEKIQELKKKKQNLFEAIIDESGDLFKKLTWEDIRDLFSS